MNTTITAPGEVSPKYLAMIQKAQATDAGRREMRYGEIQAIVAYHNFSLFETADCAFRIGFLRGMAAGKARK